MSLRERIQPQEMYLSRSEINAWAENPVTKHLFSLLDNLKDRSESLLFYGVNIGDEATNKELGVLKALDFIYKADLIYQEKPELGDIEHVGN